MHTLIIPSLLCDSTVPTLAHISSFNIQPFLIDKRWKFHMVQPIVSHGSESRLVLVIRL